jgi:rubrerythrin
MTFALPLRLLGHNNGNFFVFETRSYSVDSFDIISYRWGDRAPEYNCGIQGVDWGVAIPTKKLADIKRLVITAKVRYLWVDCVCINQANEMEKAAEIAKMYKYYKSARKCHILIDMVDVWVPQDIVDDLRFIDHIIWNMGGASLASEAMLTSKLNNRLSPWATRRWTFAIDQTTMMAASHKSFKRNFTDLIVAQPEFATDFMLKTMASTEVYTSAAENAVMCPKCREGAIWTTRQGREPPKFCPFCGKQPVNQRWKNVMFSGGRWSNMVPVSTQGHKDADLLGLL